MYHYGSFVLAVFFFAAAILFSGCARPSDEPAADNGVIYVNAAKNVKYAGSEECADCHRDIYQTYSQSEMGRAMSRLEAATLTETFPQTYEVFDSTKNFYYEMVRRGDGFYQREYRRAANGKISHERWMQAEYVMGSGNNLRMYFHDENGMLYELPLTWYAHKQRWDLSPGYREFENVRFSRYATAKCLACHNSYLEPSPAANDRYAQPYALGIGCERCHGPGELHVRQKSGEQLALPKNARTIVNPRKLSPERQLDVCRQCHLQGKAWALHGDSDWFDYRPGTLLQNHRAVYFPAKTAKEVIEVADSPHRLALSRCFKESKGALTCITCHNPHFSIKTFTRAHYNEKCLQCHAATALPANNSRHSHVETDDCVRCHMNRTGADNTLHGVSNTDHWIRIDASETKIDWTTLKQSRFAGQPVIALVPDIDARDDSRMIRQGVAYLDYYKQHDARRAYLDSAFSYLNRGLEKNKNSAAGFFHLGEIQIEWQRYHEAIASFWRAASLRANDAEAYAKLGWAYAATKKFTLANACYQQALALKPQEPRYLEGLGMALADSGAYAAAVQAYERALKIDQQNPYTFYALGNIYVQKLRQAGKAAPCFEKTVQLDPDFPNGYLNLGSTYGLLGKYSEALAALAQELAIRPRSAQALFNLGRVYSLMGKKSAARRALQQALEIEPAMLPARQMLERLQN